MPSKTQCLAVAVVLAIAASSYVVSSFRPTAESGAPKRIVPELDLAAREAIVKTAFQLLNSPRTNEGFDAASWGEPISALKPIRVRNDLMNVAIVLSEKDGVEEGLYVSIPISSYAAQVGDRFALMEQLSNDEDQSFGTLYHYRMQPGAK